MKITRLRMGNSQFPEEKEIGDAVVLALGDIFCWDGQLWQLVGGRFISEGARKVFLSYIESGWPDSDSAEWDLNMLLRGLEDEEQLTSDGTALPPDQAQKWAKKHLDTFIARVMDVCARCEKNSLSLIG
jgi:hypothetical protein